MTVMLKKLSDNAGNKVSRRHQWLQRFPRDCAGRKTPAGESSDCTTALQEMAVLIGNVSLSKAGQTKGADHHEDSVSPDAP